MADAWLALGVCPELAEASVGLGWTQPTEVQAQAIPLALAGKDVIGLAQTGSGKTAAFALPVLQARSRASDCLRRTAAAHAQLQALLQTPQPFFALVLSPTRELALQIAGQVRLCSNTQSHARSSRRRVQFDALGAGISVRTASLVGGIDMMGQAIALAKRPHVLVGTPGRVVDHLTNTKASPTAVAPP